MHKELPVQSTRKLFAFVVVLVRLCDRYEYDSFQELCDFQRSTKIYSGRIMLFVALEL